LVVLLWRAFGEPILEYLLADRHDTSVIAKLFSSVYNAGANILACAFALYWFTAGTIGGPWAIAVAGAVEELEGAAARDVCVSVPRVSWSG